MHTISDIVKQRREELGLTESTLAEKCSITIEWYGDLEYDESEFYEVLTLEKILLLANELKLDVIELYGFDKCRTQLNSNFISSRMSDLNITISGLSDKVNMVEEYIESAIKDSQMLLGWVMTPIIDLSKTLDVKAACIIELIQSNFDTK